MYFPKSSLVSRVSVLTSLLACTLDGRRVGLLSGHSESDTNAKSHIPFRLRSNGPLVADYPLGSLSKLASLLVDLKPAVAFLAPGVAVRRPVRHSVPQMSVSDELTGQHQTKTFKAWIPPEQGLLKFWRHKSPSTRRSSPVSMGSDKDVDSIFGPDDSTASGKASAPDLDSIFGSDDSTASGKGSAPDLDSIFGPDDSTASGKASAPDVDSIFGSDDSKGPSTERSPVSTFNINDIESEFEDDNVTTLTQSGKDGKVVKSLESGTVIFERFLAMSRVGFDVNLGRMIAYGNGGKGAVACQNAHTQPPHFTIIHCEGPKPVDGDFAFVQETNLTGLGWDGDPASWSGIYDYLGRPVDAAASGQQPKVDVFQPIMEIKDRREVETPLVTGVLAMDALTPMGRGQSMLIVGPDELPEGSTRSDVSNSVMAGQMFEGGVLSVLVLTDPDAAKREAKINALKEAGAFEKTRVLESQTPQEAVIAIHLACSIAQAGGGEDILVVVDDMQAFVDFWAEVEQTFDDLGRGFGKRPTDSERVFFGQLVERATPRRKIAGAAEGTTGGTLTLLMNIPSEPKATLGDDEQKSYTLEDFIKAKYTKSILDRVRFISEEKGIEITDGVLSKLKIPAPGAPRVDWGVYADTLISMVDGHVDLKLELAEEGIVPAMSASTSKQRVAIQIGKNLQWKGDKALQEFNKGLRMRLQYADDKGCRDKKLLTRAAGFKAIFQQPSLQPLTLGEELVLLFAAHNDLLEEKIEAVGAEGVRGISPYILNTVKSQAGDMVLEATKTGLLDEKTRERFTTLITEAVKSAP